MNSKTELKNIFSIKNLVNTSPPIPFSPFSPFSPSKPGYPGSPGVHRTQLVFSLNCTDEPYK